MLTGIQSSVTIVSYDKDGKEIPYKEPTAEPFPSKEAAIEAMDTLCKEILIKRGQMCVFWGSKRRGGGSNRYRPYLVPHWIEKKLYAFNRRLEASNFDV